MSLSVNGHEIHKSPFRITIPENSAKHSKIITSDDDGFDQLWGIACSNNGMWAVADRTGNCIHLFDNRDKLIRRFGSKGSKNGQFRSPCDVVFDDNDEIYVSDRCNHRVQKFGTHGDYILQFGEKGTGEGQLNQPVGISVHKDKVYIADRLNHRISVFQCDGIFYSVIGQSCLSRYFGIAVNIHGEILVVDKGFNFIDVFTLEGHFTGLRKGIKSLGIKDPCSLTTYLNEFALITDHSISIFDASGNCIRCFESDDQLKLPRGVAIAPNGSSIYVSDTGNNRVQVFDMHMLRNYRI